MRKYELMVIINPTLTDDQKKKTLDKIKTIVEKAKGKIVSIDEWGKRPFAYKIQKFSDGFYSLLNLELPADSVKDMSRNIQLEENIIRYLLVNKE